jgi:MFS family permease
MSEDDATAVQQAQPSMTRQVLMALSGAVVVAFLLGQVGSLTHRTEQGVAAGLVIGLLAGWGMSKGYVQPFVGRMFLFAVMFALMGAGCGADPLSSSLFGIVFGLVMTWQRTAVLGTAVLGAILTKSIFGLLAGTLGWWMAYRAPAQIHQCFKKRPIIDRPSYASLRR